MTELIAKNGIWMALGALLGVMGWHPWDSWQWWAWFVALMWLVMARDWAMSSNVELTGSGRLHRPESSDRRERG